MNRSYRFGEFRILPALRELWRGEIYRKLREAHLSGDFDAHGFCGQCPDWAQTRWPGEGRSYADLVAELKAGAA